MARPQVLLEPPFTESPEDEPDDLAGTGLAVLEAIADAILRDGWAPSYRELSRATKLLAISNVVYWLDRLMNAGLISHGNGARTLAVTKAGWLALAEAETTREAA